VATIDAQSAKFCRTGFVMTLTPTPRKRLFCLHSPFLARGLLSHSN